jgi:hypothetical protein
MNLATSELRRIEVPGVLWNIPEAKQRGQSTWHLVILGVILFVAPF